MATFNNNVMTFGGRLQMKRGTSDALENSDYVPAAGEIIAAIDTGQIKSGDGTHTWSELPTFSPTSTTVVNSYSEDETGKALDAVKGKDLNDRISAFENLSGIDCGEISAS